MSGRQRRRIAQEGAAAALIRPLGLRQFSEGRIFQPGAKVAERILVGDQVDAQLPAPGVQFENLTSGKKALGQSNGLFNFDLRPFSAPDQRGPSFAPSYPAYRTLPEH